MIYEYVGFKFRIVQDDVGRYKAIALPNQHKAAYKDKHARAALEMFLEEYGE